MKTRWLLGIALTVCLCAQEILNNDTILKLVKAGVGDDVIVGMVSQQPGKYLLTADGIIALKTAGVSDKVISAMIVRNGASSELLHHMTMKCFLQGVECGLFTDDDGTGKYASATEMARRVGWTRHG